RAAAATGRPSPRTEASLSFEISELSQPFFSLRFRYDRQDLDCPARNVIEHPYFVDAQSKLRTAQAPESLDAASTRLPWLVPQMPFERGSDCRANVRFEPLEVFDGFGCQDDSERHSGQIVARIQAAVKGLWLRSARLALEELLHAREEAGRVRRGLAVALAL